MKLILILLAISLSLFASGQDDVTTKNEACDPTLTHWIVETLPEYEGGYEKLVQDLNADLNPGKHLKGTCRIDFMVNCKGKTYDYKTETSFDKDFGKKFTKAFSELQNWTAGKNENENVDCSYTLVFLIDNGIIKKNNNNLLP